MNNYIISLNRLDVCDLLLACTFIFCDAREEMNDPNADAYRREKVLPGTYKKWKTLYDKIERQLDILDALNTEK